MERIASFDHATTCGDHTHCWRFVLARSRGRRSLLILPVLASARTRLTRLRP